MFRGVAHNDEVVVHNLFAARAGFIDGGTVKADGQSLDKGIVPFFIGHQGAVDAVPGDVAAIGFTPEFLVSL